MPSELRLTLVLTEPRMNALRVDLAAFLSAHDVQAHQAGDILLAVTEAVTNAARHSGSSEAEVHVLLFDHSVAVTVTDDGVGFDLTRADRSCPPHP
jgi:signal transduction histidine kinase